MPRRTKAEELLNFEIAFYEKLLHAYPDFVDVLIPLGNAYTRLGSYDKGLGIDLRLTEVRGDDPLTWYNLACSYSLLKRVTESLGALRRSFELGYADMGYMQKDPDLLHVRQSPEYRDLVQSLASMATSTRTKADKPNPAV